MSLWNLTCHCDAEAKRLTAVASLLKEEVKRLNFILQHKDGTIENLLHENAKDRNIRSGVIYGPPNQANLNEYSALRDENTKLHEEIAYLKEMLREYKTADYWSDEGFKNREQLQRDELQYGTHIQYTCDRKGCSEEFIIKNVGQIFTTKKPLFCEMCEYGLLHYTDRYKKLHPRMGDDQWLDFVYRMMAKEEWYKDKDERIHKQIKKVMMPARP